MDSYDIQPYIGVGQLKFGMKKEAVEKILGPAEKSSKSPLSNEMVEFRQKSSLQLVYSADYGELAEISLYASGIPNVTFKDKDLFKMDGEKALKYLTEEDGNPLEDVGIFAKIGNYNRWIHARQ